MSRKAVKFIVFLIFLAFGVALGLVFNLQDFLDPQKVRSAIAGFGASAPLAFVGLKIFLSAFFLPGTPVNIAGGLLFGPALGTVYVLAGDILGAIIAFVAARHLASEFIHHLLELRFKKLYEYSMKTEEHGFWVTLFLRLAQIFPFNLLNLALGVSRVKLKDFILATLLGSLPGVYLYVSLGDALIEPEAESIGILVGFIVVLWLFGLGLREHFKHKEKESAIIETNQDLRKQK